MATKGKQSMTLNLKVTDTETIAALQDIENEEERNAYALSALTVGIHTLRTTRTTVDHQTLQRESDMMIKSLGSLLENHGSTISDRLTSDLANYFHPNSGRFTERVERLVKRDGELEQVLRRNVGDAHESVLGETLRAHTGPDSPLMRLLNPEQSEGLVQLVVRAVEDSASLQRERMLSEFSLDNHDSALNRLVNEVSKTQGVLVDNVKVIQKEFSLDSEGSALNRLVSSMDEQQRLITKEFKIDDKGSALYRLDSVLRDTKDAIDKRLTLDDDASPLYRLRKELLGVLNEHATHNREFQEEVKVAMGSMMGKKEGQAKSTRGGIEFESAVHDFVKQHIGGGGDVVEATGNTTGLIKNCKVGDIVVQLGVESIAAGARVVIEAKQARSYNISKALEEMARARSNRDADIGIFVLSQATVQDPSSRMQDTEPFTRYGDDLVVVWDSEDSNTDVFLTAALTTAKALAVRREKGVSENEERLTEKEERQVEQALRNLDKRLGGLDQITKHTETIVNATTKILDRSRLTRKAIEAELGTLDGLLKGRLR